MTRRYPNGETHRKVSYSQSITIGGEPGELKHLSNLRKRKKTRFPKYRRANGEEPDVYKETIASQIIWED